VVVLNKIDLPHVAEQQAALEARLKEVIPHTRFMAVSAMRKTNTAELMHRVRVCGGGGGCVCLRVCVLCVCVCACVVVVVVVGEWMDG
jgi:hypothetical protein